MAPPAIDRAARIADGFLCTGGIGMDTYVECLAANGKKPEEGNIILGCWAIIAEDPEAEAERVGPHVLYQSNEYIRWGAFGPPDQTPLFPDAKTAIENGLYELWDADMAVEKLSGMIEQYPQISDIHLWAQFPGESVEAGDRRLKYIAEKVLPRLR
jgi:alkanesulfonate monooxygenase SsuD/methylene tetrahydromethanopterin reductase-like flavin-dependent oxidoreductase (luciferase family)